MNSVLFHDPEKANQLAGRYAMGLTDVYQTLHDRLLEALQKWIPPHEKPDEMTHITAAASSPQPPLSPAGRHGSSADLPMLFYPLTIDGIDPGLTVGPGGIQFNLQNIHLLLAKSASSVQPQTSSSTNTTSIAPSLETTATPASTSVPFSSPITNNQNATTVSQSRFYPPLTVCTAGPQCTTLEQLSTTDNAPSGLRNRPRKNGFHINNTESNTPPVQNQNTSFNLLHQLLSGADVSQVRTRSELVEPSLCIKSICGSSDSKSKSVVKVTNSYPLSIKHPQHSTPNESQMSELLEETGSIGSDWSLTSNNNNNNNANRVVSFQPSIPSSTFHPTHSPMDMTPTISTATVVPSCTASNPSVVQQPSAIYSLSDDNPQSISHSSALLAEKLLYLLIELQKTQMTHALAVEPRPNPSPCSSLVDGQGTPISLNSPMPVISKSTTPTSTERIRELWTAQLPSTSSGCDCLPVQLPSSSKMSVHTKWTSPQQSRHDFPHASDSPLRTIPPEKHQVAHNQPDQSYEPRPRSKSDVHNTTRRHIRLSRDHRSRSQTKTDRFGGGCLSVTSVEQNADYTPDSGACELESSLFAQLILSPDSPTCSTPRSTGTDSMTVASTGGDSMPCRNYTPTRELIPSPSKPTSLVEDSAPLICHSGSRNQVFEWLRESDLFVAEHCFDIPLGALLATAISPGRSNLAEICCSALFTPNPPADPVPGLAKHVVNKLWHQLLLVALIENNFVPLCVTNKSSCPQRSATVSGHSWRESHAQPLRDKVLNAISSLAALDVEESPAPDEHLVTELKQLVTSGNQMKLTPELFRLIRFCILAQNAYPHHFSTTYSEALSELESELAVTSDAPTLVDVLKLLNHLHCFDAGTLKQFFGLSCDHPTSVASASVPVRTTNTAITSPSENWSCGSGSFKRKAYGACGLANRNQSIDRDPSPLQFRSRAYTTTGCNKSARLCTTTTTSTNTIADRLTQSSVSGATRIQGRPRSDTVPTDHHHHQHNHRRPERPWKAGIR